MKNIVVFILLFLSLGLSAQDSRGVPSTSTQATHQGVMSWDSVLGKWYPRTGVSLAAYTNYWLLESGDLSRNSNVAIGVPSGSSYIARLRVKGAGNTYASTPTVRFDNSDGVPNFLMYGSGEFFHQVTTAVSGFGDFVTETTRDGGAKHVIRNNSNGTGSYAGIVLNCYGNSWGMEMGSIAKNENALTWNSDALGANTERMRLTIDGKLGIATSSPNALLEVNGEVRMGGNYAGTPEFRFGTDNFLHFNVSQSSGFRWDNATLMFNGQDEGIQAVPYSSSYVGFSVKGAAGQTYDLQRWKNSAGTTLASVSATGDISISSFTNGGNIVTHNGSGTLVSSSPASILSTAGAFLQNGNSFGAKATLGTNDAFALQFEVNNIVRGQISTSGNLNIGATGSNNARATFGTGGQESPQVMIKTAQDSVHLAVTNANPNSVITTQKGSLVLDGTNAKAYLNTSTGETGTTYTQITTGAVPVVREVLSNGVDIPAAGVINTGWYRVPAAYNGYSLIGVSYAFQNAGSGTGEIVLQVDKNGTGVHGGTVAVGDLQKDVEGTGITVATGDLLKFKVLSNSMTTVPTGLVGTLLFIR